jgi:alpha-tubulin suppressor-like RCC1 family protein
LWGWGNSQSGQVKGYNTVPYSTPVQTTLGGNNWKQVSCGTYHTAAIKTNGELWIWGENSYYGALGLGVISIVPSQVQTILGGTDWKQVSAGDDRTYAVKTDGTLWAWGSGTGTGFGIGNPTPTKVGTGTNWKQVSSSNGTAIYFYDADNLYPSA